MMKKLIIDTDPGVDDSLALILAAMHSANKIKAIVSVFGNNSVDKTTENIIKILSLLKKNEILKESIPAIKGSSKPLKKKYKPVFDIHGIDGLGNINLTLSGDSYIQSGYSEDIVAKIVRENSNDITILTLGPLTNLAKLVKKYTSLCSLIKEVVIMGGTYLFPGNYNFSIEANFGWDPDAAKIVLNAPFNRITIIPLNVTEDFQLNRSLIAKIKKKELRAFVDKMTNNYINFYGQQKKYYVDSLLRRIQYKGGAIHDVVACLYALGYKSFFRLSTGFNFDIETKGDNSGMLKINTNKLNNLSNKSNIYFATRINKKQLWKSFFSIINKK